MSQSLARKGSRWSGRLIIALVVAGLVVLVASRGLRDSSELVVQAVEGGRELPSAAGFEALSRQWEDSDEPLGAWQALEADPQGLRVGTIDLDLEYGSFTIRPGQPGEGVRVTGEYAPEAFDLTERFEEQQDGSWAYRLTFGAKGGTMGAVPAWGRETQERTDHHATPRYPLRPARELGDR